MTEQFFVGLRGPKYRHRCSQGAWTELHQIRWGHSPVIGACNLWKISYILQCFKAMAAQRRVLLSSDRAF